MLRLTEAQIRVLRAWEKVPEEFGVLCFSDISKRCGVEKSAVATVVRGFANDGLAKFARGTFTENGTLYGSGYELTDAGRAALERSEG